MQANGTLYLVATPIGNLSDISPRAVSVLQDVAFIASEDTRVTRKLLSHLGLKKSLISYRAQNENVTSHRILTRLHSGENCALVSDAGTPVVSDPGNVLVRLCIDNNIPVIAIPGPCAAITGLILSGFSAGRFTFEGFLPAASGKRSNCLAALKNETRTMIFYEAPHKLVRTLNDMSRIFGGDRRISVSRELTKLYDETLHMTLSEAAEHFTANTPRGEFVVVVEGTTVSLSQEDDNLSDALMSAEKYIDDGMSVRDAVKKAALNSGCSSNKLYKEVLKDKTDYPGT